MGIETEKFPVFTENEKMESTNTGGDKVTDEEMIESAELEAEHGEITDPDFTDPKSIVNWYGKKILHYLRMMRREKAEKRLRLLATAVDTWIKTYKLCAETADLEEVREQLFELKKAVEREQGIHVA